MRGSFVAVLLLTLAGVVCGADRPTLSIEYARSVRAIIGVEEGRGDYLPMYSAAIRADGAMDDVDTLLFRLAEAATSKPRVGLIASELEASIQVDTQTRHTAGISRGVGAFANREKLIIDLGNAAGRRAPNNPDLARVYARACIVLAADEGLVVANVVPLVWVLKREQVVTLAGLDDRARAQLKRVCDDYRSPRQSVDAVIAAARLLDAEIARLRDSDAPAAPSKWPELCASISRAFSESRRHPGCELDAAQLTWRAACLARSVNDDGRLTVLTQTVRQCQPAASDFGARLIDEALTKPGPRPEYSGFRFFESPDDWKPKR